jgi:hypothetical protein
VPFFSKAIFGCYEKLYVKQARNTSASNERKGFGGKRWCPIAEIYQNFPEEPGERHKKKICCVT